MLAAAAAAAADAADAAASMINTVVVRGDLQGLVPDHNRPKIRCKNDDDGDGRKKERTRNVSILQKVPGEQLPPISFFPYRLKYFK